MENMTCTSHAVI